MKNAFSIDKNYCSIGQLELFFVDSILILTANPFTPIGLS